MKNLKFIVLFLLLIATICLVACADDGNSPQDQTVTVTVADNSETLGLESYSVKNGSKIITDQADDIVMLTQLTVEWTAAQHYNAYLCINNEEIFHASPYSFYVNCNTVIEFRLIEEEKSTITINDYTNGKASVVITMDNKEVDLANDGTFEIYRSSSFTISATAYEQNSRIVTSGIWSNSDGSIYSVLRGSETHRAVVDATIGIYIQHSLAVNNQTYGRVQTRVIVGNQEDFSRWVFDGEEVAVIVEDTDYTFEIEGAQATSEKGIYKTTITSPHEISIVAIMHEVMVINNCRFKPTVLLDKYFGINNTDFILYESSRTFKVFDNNYIAFKVSEWPNLVYSIEGAEKIEPYVYRALITSELTITITEEELPICFVKFEKIRHPVIGEGPQGLQVVYWSYWSDKTRVIYTMPETIQVFQGHSIYISGYDLLPGHIMAIDAPYYSDGTGSTMRVVVTESMTIKFESIYTGYDINPDEIYLNLNHAIDVLELGQLASFPLPVVTIQGKNFVGNIHGFGGGNLNFAYDSFGSPNIVGTYIFEVSSPSSSAWEEDLHMFQPLETGIFVIKFKVTMYKDILELYGVFVDEDLILNFEHTLTVY